MSEKIKELKNEKMNFMSPITFGNKSKQKTISIDIPSGINGDTGKVYGYAIRANVTLALHSKKIGHTLYPGRNYCGKIIVVDIGMSKKFNNYIE